MEHAEHFTTFTLISFILIPRADLNEEVAIVKRHLIPERRS
jgi:hypothetical protein